MLHLLPNVLTGSEFVAHFQEHGQQGRQCRAKLRLPIFVGDLLMICGIFLVDSLGG